MKQGAYQDVTITSKGQLTLPVGIRNALNLGIKRKVRVAVKDEGIITMRPLPDVMSFYGGLKSKVKYSPAEKQIAREAMGRRSMRRSRNAEV